MDGMEEKSRERGWEIGGYLHEEKGEEGQNKIDKGM